MTTVVLILGAWLALSLVFGIVMGTYLHRGLAQHVCLRYKSGTQRVTDAEVAMPKILAEMSRAELEDEAEQRRVWEPRKLSLPDLRRAVRMKRLMDGSAKQDVSRFVSP